jgi:hypothetical protein
VPNPYTVSNVVASLKRRGQIPRSSERSFGEDDLIALMSEELQTYMVTLLMGIREEWFVHTKDVTTDGSTRYAIPERSIGSKLRQVLLGSGGNNYLVLNRIEPKQAYESIYGLDTNPAGFSNGYILYDTEIQIVPTQTTGQTLRMVYFRRPNRLVAEDACGLITAIDTDTREVTVTAGEVPTTFTSSVTYDLVSGRPGFRTLAMDQSVTVASNVLTFAQALPDGLQVGDYVCLAGESPIPQIPVEMQPLLAQRTVVKVLEALGDPKVATAKAMLDDQRNAAITLLTPRSEGDSRFLTNFHGPGWSGRWPWRG